MQHVLIYDDSKNDYATESLSQNVGISPVKYRRATPTSHS